MLIIYTYVLHRYLKVSQACHSVDNRIKTIKMIMLINLET